MEWCGIANVVDIHLSNNFVSFGATEFADKSSTTIYVANENVKEKLQQKFKKCQIVIGEPQSTEKFKVNYSITNIEIDGKKIGEIEAWTMVHATSKQVQTYPKAIAFRYGNTIRRLQNRQMGSEWQVGCTRKSTSLIVNKWRNMVG